MRLVVGLALTVTCGLPATAGARAGHIPRHTDPCTHPRWWPNAARSTTLPIEVHYPRGVDAAVATRVVGLLERAYAIETGPLGFPAPLTGARCGSDDALDVFLWPGSTDDYVEGLAPVDATPADDWTTYMVLDPDGEGGGDRLPATVAHELAHMCQAADDWDEPSALLEATATYVEAAVEPSLAARADTTSDFQAEPGWSPDHDDGYASWFMYGATLYLEVLRDAFLGGRPTAIAEVWRRMRDASDDAAPSWADAVAAAVAPATLDDTIVRLAVWRWYVGDRDDGHHLRGAATLEAPPEVAEAAPGTRRVALGRLDALGAVYVGVAGGTASAWIDGLPRGLTVRVLALPGTAGADADELVPDEQGAYELDAADGPRTLAIVVVPRGGYDPADPPAPVRPRLRLAWR